MTPEQEKLIRETVASAVESEAKLIKRMLQLRATKYLDFIFSEINKDGEHHD